MATCWPGPYESCPSKLCSAQNRYQVPQTALKRYQREELPWSTLQEKEEVESEGGAYILV